MNPAGVKLEVEVDSHTGRQAGAEFLTSSQGGVGRTFGGTKRVLIDQHCPLRRTHCEYTTYMLVQPFNDHFIHLPATPGQLSLAIPTWVGAVSTSQTAVMLRGWGVNAGIIRAWVLGETDSLAITGHI